MTSNLRLYSWKEYKCVTCKNLFAGNKLFKYPTQWGYDLAMCRNCYKKVK